VGSSLAVGLVLGLLRVDGAATCPAPGDVAAALERLAPEAGGGGDRAQIDPVPGGVEIVLYGEGGERKKERRLLADAACGELAEAAAVVIAAWERELAARPPSPVRLVAAPATPTRVGFDLGAAFVGALVGRSFAPGGGLQLTVVDRGPAPRRRLVRAGGRLELVATGTRDVAVAAGHASYTRAWLALGPVVRFAPSRLLLDVHAQVALALVSIEGIGYVAPRHDFDVDPGLSLGARLGVRVGPVAPFVGVSLSGWLRRQRLVVDGVADAAQLPQLEALLSAGIAVGVL
jgi:hypothetical protein